MTSQITVSQMPFPKHEGDWHDRPLRWTVNGPANEVQNFSTKKDAMKFASLRRRSTDYSTASRQFLAWEG